ncbi:hypothetical protein PROFUN_01084 [Planoprotostelium fungivorum]|uniref:Uncharacterized protein n=1 Tax=Planoprotostelium fungivorum TaxID=1890364 RepID=A0A2P6NC94_9EUKA|nr:hypothetical protein PROFUN_01084 [Planoprotostelium fungivorum]
MADVEKGVASGSSPANEKKKLTKKKGKGKKKLTKKQKLAAAEETRKREELERETREREWMARADSECRAYERELRYQSEEKERREWEQEQIDKIETHVEQSKKEWHTRMNETSRWRKYIQGSQAINVHSESQINTWISVWIDQDNAALEETIQTCQEAEDIISELELLIEEHREGGEHEGDLLLLDRYRNNIYILRETQMMKIDRTTAVMIQKADEHASIKGEVLFQHQHSQIKYGLWVNVTKNPRIKRVDFSSIGLSTDVPKNLALTSVAIRMMHFAFDYLAHKSLSEYQAVGGILYMELLALPPPPKKVKGWTLRQITPLANNVSRLNYPPAVGIGVEVANMNGMTGAVGANLGWAPLRVVYALPSHVIIRDDVPVLGWWSKESNTWRTDGISEIEYDAPTKTIVFKTNHVTAIAVIIPRYFEFPISFWELKPLDRNEAVLTVTTASGRNVRIKVGEGYCRVFEPMELELYRLEQGKFTPIELLRALSSSGINILPDNNTAIQVKDHVTIKDPTLEKKLCKEISQMAGTFAFRWSRWNNMKEKRKIVFMAKEARESSHRQREGDTDEGWSHVLYQERSCTTVNTNEKSAKFSEDLVEGGKIHQHLYHCLQPANPYQPSIPSVAFTSTLQTLLLLLRLPSFSA